MKAFRNLVLIFFVPIALIGIGMEVLLRQIPNRFQLQHEYLLQHGKEIETIILGSSHTQFGINPEYLSTSAFNLSNVSQTVDIDLELLKKYEPQLPNLKHIILRLSYTTLFERLEESNESWRMKDYVIYQNLATNNADSHFEIMSLPLSQNLERVYDYYCLDKTTVNSNSLGWGNEAESTTSKDLQQTGKAVAKKHTIVDQMFYHQNMDDFISIADWANERSIDLYIVTLPAYKTYIQNLEPQQLKKTEQFGQQLESSYPEVKYLNFLRDARFEKTDFYDADHLNELGAEKFSRILHDTLNL